VLHVAGVVLVSNLHGKPRGENASVQVLSQGVPELESPVSVYALGLVPVGFPEAAEIDLAKSMLYFVLNVHALVELSVTCVKYTVCIPWLVW